MLTSQTRRKMSGGALGGLSYLVLGLFLLFTVGPILWLIGLSLKTQLQAFASPPLIIFKPTFENYVNLFVDEGFLQFFLNSLIISTASTVVALLLGTPAAYALVKLRSRWKNAVAVWVILMRMAPTMTYIIPFFIFYNRTGLIDTRTGLVIAYLTLNLPLVIWLMRSFLLDVPQSLEEAAIVDGASVPQAFVRVIVPVVAPGILSAAILAFVMAWNEFIFALVLTRNVAVTASIAVVNLIKYAGTEWGQMGAGAVILMIPSVLIAVLLAKYLARGLIQGAVKE